MTKYDRSTAAGFVSAAQVAAALEIKPSQTVVLLELLGSVIDSEEALRYGDGECCCPARAIAVLGCMHKRQGAQLTLPNPMNALDLSDADGSIVAIDLYRLVLYLFVHFYAREAYKAETADVWPADIAHVQQEPSSPMKMTARAWGGGKDPCKWLNSKHLPISCCFASLPAWLLDDCMIMSEPLGL